MKIPSFFLFLLSWAFTLIAHTGYEDIADKNALQIQTPSLSSQKRSKIRLDNGMEVLLISDPEATQSAASLCVEVGSWSDPTAYPGMAHFVEHLIFLGSRTYPDEGSYFKQVTQGGGMLNAFTTSDRTVYTFSVNHDAFSVILNYFSHMFIDPLFSQSSIRRELHAIDQEHDKNVENEYIRTLMVMRATGNPHHPNARFTAGNASTLENIPNTAITKWYQDHYSSDKAHLVLYSPETPNTLKELAVAHFSHFPLKPSSRTVFPKQLTNPEQEGKMTYITPIREVRELGIHWELPSAFFTNKEDSSSALLSYILSSQHRGSLYHQLKEEQLIETVSARLQPLSKDSGFYAIKFVLTPRGVGQKDYICMRLFESLKRLKNDGIPHYIFEEAHKIAKLDYEYQGRADPFNWVSELAYYMAEESLETFPQKLMVPSTYSAEKTLHFLKYLDPYTAQYILKAPHVESGVRSDTKEKWSGAEYAIRKIHSLQMEKWSSVRPNSSAIYPKQNPYIPSHFELVTTKRTIEKTPVPQVLTEDEYGKVYHWEDERYLVPEISWIISFKSPHIRRDARQLALCDLFEKCLDEHLASTTYYARAAGLGSAVKIDDCTLTLSINGFHQHALSLLEVMLEGLKSCAWTKREFELHRRLLMTDYDNFNKSPSHHQGWVLMKWVVLKNYPKHDEQLSALEKITYEDFLCFKTDLLKQLYGEAMLAGNLTKKDAEQVWHTVQTKLHYAPFPKEQSIQSTYLSVPQHIGPCRVRQNIKSLGHTAILVLQNDTFSLQKSASAAVLEKGMAEDFFDTLRTKQQTAYIAKSHKIDEDKRLYQVFLVQSSTHKPEELIDRFELFLEGYVKDFESKISRTDFANIRDSLVARYEKQPENLHEMARFLYTLGFKCDANFRYMEEKIDAIANLDYDTFRQHSIQCLSRKNPRRIALMLEGYSPKGKDFSYKQLSIEELKSQSTYVH